MSEWAWTDPGWRSVVGDNIARSVRDALRRGINLRDTLAETGRGEETARALFLVDVLSHLATLLNGRIDDLWDRT